MEFPFGNRHFKRRILRRLIMNKRFLISWLVIAVASHLFGFLVHVVLLGKDYHTLVPNLFRTGEAFHKVFPFMILANILFGFGFTWIYRKGVETGKSVVGQGVRYGLAVAVLATIPMYLTYYVVQPLPNIVAVKQILFEVPCIVILGIIVALLNPPGK
jgi:hypothetical protein